MLDALTYIILTFGTLLISIFLILGIVTLYEHSKSPYLKSISQEIKKIGENFEAFTKKESDSK